MSPITINLANSEPLLVLVGGVDCSRILVSLKMGYSSISPESASGLCVLTGELVLGADPMWQTAEANRTGLPVSATMDDRLNPLWQRGTRVEVYHGVDHLKVGGWSYIESAQWDELSLLNIKLVCSLGLHNNITPADLGVCVPPLSEVPVWGPSGAIEILLRRAGIGLTLELPQTWEIPTSLRRVTQVPEGGSLVKEAGSLAAGSGRVLYQTNTGSISTLSTQYTPDRAPDLTVNDRRELLQYSRWYGIDQPPDRVNITGADIIVKPALVETSVDTSGEGANQTTVTVTRNASNRVITTVTEDTVGSRVKKRVTQVATYEATSATAGFDPVAASFGQCVPADEGRLLSVVTTELEEQFSAFAEWNEVSATTEDQQYARPQLTSYSLVETRNIREDWLYMESNEAAVVTKTTVRQTAQGILIPFAADATLGREPDPTLGVTQVIVNPGTLITDFHEKLVWSLQPGGDWTTSETSYASQMELTPGAIRRAAVATGPSAPPVQTVVSRATSLGLRTRNLKQSGSSPSISRFPPEQTESTSLWRVQVTRVPLNSLRGGKVTSISLKEDGINGVEEAVSLGKAVLEATWGQHKGQLISLPLLDVGDTPVHPWLLFRVNSDDSEYLVDAPTVTIDTSSAVLSFNGLLRSAGGIYPAAPTPDRSFEVSIDGSVRIDSSSGSGGGGMPTEDFFFVRELDDQTLVTWGVEYSE